MTTVTETEIYKVELEAQRLELRSSRILLEETLHLYADLYDYAAVACLTLGKGGVILDANLTCSELLRRQRDQLIGAPLARSLHPDSTGRFFAHLRRCRGHAPKQAVRLRLLPRLGGVDVLLISSPRLEAPPLPEASPEIRIQSALIDLSLLKPGERDRL